MAQRVLTPEELPFWTTAGVVVPPKPSDLGAFRPFPVEVLPDPLAGYVIQAAASIGCDTSLVAVPLLGCTAGCIGNSRVIQLKESWPEPCVLWCMTVAESGSAKSPAQDAVTRPLTELTVDQVRAHAEAMAEHQRQLALHEADYAAWKAKGRGKGEPPPEEPPEPVCDRITVSDVTVEALAVIAADNPRGLVAVLDEGGQLLSGFNQYKNGRGGDVQQYLSMHGARPLIVDRKGAAKGSKKTIVVPRAALSIVAGTQPQSLRRHLGQEYFENGLAARFFLACPPPRARTWTEASISPTQSKTLAEVYRRLRALEGDFDERGEPVPVSVPLTPSGKSAWVKFYNEHAREHAELSGNLSAAWSKLEGGAARLALVIHCVREVWFDTSLEDPQAVDGESIQAGVTIARWFAHEARRIYAQFAESEEERDQRELVEAIAKAGGKTSSRHLSRLRRCSTDEAEAMLNGLAKASLGRWDFIPAGPSGGRPTRVFLITPECDKTKTPKIPEVQGGFVTEPSPTAPPMGDAHEADINRLLAEAGEVDR